MIPTALYESYAAALSENDRQAKAALALIISKLDPSDVDAVRDTLLEAYPALVKLYGERAAQVALEFYTGVRDAQGVTSGFNAVIAPVDEDVYDEYEADVRREVGALYSGTTSMNTFTSIMQGLATKRTMQMADDTLFALAKADPAKPKVALVPHPGACAWCVLLGARGFSNTEENMSHMRHDGCKCTTVVDFDRDNPALDGYDPADYYDIYEQVRDRNYRSEWNALSDEEKVKYVRKGQNVHGEYRELKADYATFRRNRQLQEMNKLLGNTQRTRIEIDFAKKARNPEPTTQQQASTKKSPKGSDPDMSKRADEILREMGIR